MPRFNKILILSSIILLLPVFIHAVDLATTCQQILSTEDSCQNMSASECKATLESCASYYDQQSAAIAQDLSKTQQQKNTLQNQISSLKKKISSLEYQINQGTIMVKDLNIQISDTQVSIDKTGIKVDDTKSKIEDILRSVYQEDEKDPIIVLLEGNLSDFFSNLVYLENLNAKVSDLLESSQDLQTYLQNQKDKQEGEKTQLQKTIKIQNLQKKQNESNKAEQQKYLKLTEVQYQQQLKDKQDADKKASTIKSRIFELIGVSKAPTFEEALNIAKYVSGITGVRPAFLLAIITQESSLGKNVGQCYLTDYNTGNGTNLQGTPKQRVMNPKSIPGFITLTESLGMDSKKTPVSCWIPLYTSKKAPYGWGGAMGPAQFIASTWVLYENQATSILGKKANPWNIKDAFLTSGLLLQDNGATSSESNAAAKYYCGGNYTRYECKAYANSVLKYASQYEADIKAIGG